MIEDISGINNRRASQMRSHLIELMQKAWRLWRRVGLALGDIIARVALSVFYFTIVVPFALGTRMLTDQLSEKPLDKSTGWRGRQISDRTIEDAKRQF